MTVARLPSSRSKTIVLWTLRFLMAGLFLFASFMKLTGDPMMVQEFNTIGLGQGFRYVTGAIELAGGIAILFSSISVLAAIVLLAVDAGAFVAQIAVLHADWIHTIVVGAFLGIIIYLQHHQFMSKGKNSHSAPAQAAGR